MAEKPKESKLWQLIKLVGYVCITLGATSSLLSALIKKFGITSATFEPIAPFARWGCASIAVLIAVLAVVVAGRFWSVRRARREVYERQVSRMTPLHRAICGDDPELKSLIRSFAASHETRVQTWHLLDEYTLTYLFPDEFLNSRAAAEGYLVNWLENPNELGKLPAAIEYLCDAEALRGGNYRIFKFAYQMDPDKEEISWFIGVVGPYFPATEPYDPPDIVFSRFNNMNDTSVDEEVDWIESFGSV